MFASNGSIILALLGGRAIQRIAWVGYLSAWRGTSEGIRHARGGATLNSETPRTLP
jgi:hypothetical protein